MALEYLQAFGVFVGINTRLDDVTFDGLVADESVVTNAIRIAEPRLRINPGQ